MVRVSSATGVAIRAQVVELAGGEGAHEVGRAEAAAARREDEGLGERAVDLVGGREAGLAHAVEHGVAPAQDTVCAFAGIVEGRAARHAREGRGLRQGELARGLVEVEPARGLDAAQAGAEGHAVQVLLEDLVLREGGLDAEGEDHLAELAARGAGTRDHRAGELLGQGRRARDEAAVPDGLDGGARHGQRVDAGMDAEAKVLGRDHGPRHAVAHFGERDPASALPVVRAVLAQEHAVAIADDERHVGGRRLAERRGQVGEGRGDGEDQPRHEERGARDLEAAAEAGTPGEGGAGGGEHRTGRSEGRAEGAPGGEARRDHFGATVTEAAAVRPKTSGAYISSARAGGSTNVPWVVARARYR
jgi:hypothetical protein